MNRIFCFVLLLMLTVVSTVNAQTFSKLHAFGDGTVPTDGMNPLSMVLGSDGNLYGVTNTGGAANTGTIFKATPGGTVTILHSFSALSNTSGSGTNTDGANPYAKLVQGSDGNFYGTACYGGSAGDGTVYKITPGGTFTLLHTFGDGSVSHDGIYPFGILLGTDGNFYGVADSGGAAGNGAVYEMTPSGVVTIFASNPVANGDIDDLDSSISLIQGTDGNFYGTIEESGSNGEGMIFKVTPTGTFTTLHNFGDGSVASDGLYIASPLVQGSDGNFYGTTEYGGTAEGTAFRMTPAGTVTILHDFADGTLANDGAVPDASLIQGGDGNFYGTTVYGGTSGGGSSFEGSGTLFKMTPAGAVTIVYDFSALSSASPYTNMDGAFSFAPLVQVSSGVYYGTATAGGSAADGTLFRFGISGTPLTITSLSPASTAGSNPAFILTITGTNYTANTTVTFGSTPVTVTSQTATQLKVTVPASALTTVGPVTVTASDPRNGSATAIFMVTLGWNVRDLAAVSDGTARLLWTRNDGEAGIWIVSAADTQISAGPVYGPYQGWAAQDVTAASDGTSRILWNRYDGATGVWAMDAHGNQISVSPTYGPFSGWKAIDLAASPDGSSRLMWRYTNGEAGLLSLNPTGGQIISGRSYGPYAGWTATAVGAAGDGTARMLWTRSDGAMGLWTMDAGDLQKAVGPTYGPYSDSHGAWTATDLSTSSDGTSQVLWKRSDGAIGVWTFGANNTMTTVGSVYGPYVGFTAAAMDAANDKARVLWVRSDRAAGLWSFGSNDLENLIGPVYGPY